MTHAYGYVLASCVARTFAICCKATQCSLAANHETGSEREPSITEVTIGTPAALLLVLVLHRPLRFGPWPRQDCYVTLRLSQASFSVDSVFAETMHREFPKHMTSCLLASSGFMSRLRSGGQI